MARKFLVGIDLNKNELSNAVIQNLATAPASPAAGQIYYNTSDNTLYFWSGSAWVNVVQAAEILYGTLASRPAASTAGRLYYATDNFLLYFDNGTAWAQIDRFGTVTAQTTYGLSSSSGSSTDFARADHTHGTPALGTATPSAITVAGTGSAGSATAPSKEDHTHAGPGFGNSTATTTYGLTAANGTATTIARSDHTHGTPALSTNAATNITATTAANGTGTAPAKDDHVHGFTPGNFAVSAFGQAVANVNLNSNKIINLATPTADADAANKGYVDSVAQGLDVKASVRAATTVAGTLATSFANGQVIDGVTLVTGNRILIKNQATASENGIYTVNASGAPTRSTDMDVAAEFPGAFTFVEEGTTNLDTGWVCTTNAPVTVGTTPITWAQFSSAGAYTASNGVLLTGNNFTFNPLSTGGLQTAAGGASVLLPTNSGLGTSASGLAVGAGTGITVSGGTVALTNTAVTVNGTSIALGASGTITAVNPNALTLGTGLTGTSYTGSAAVTAAIDTTVVVRKFNANVGDGTSTAITITHNLNTRDVSVTLYENSGTYAEVICDVEHTTVNTVTLRFSVAPTSNQYRVAVQG